MEYDVIIGTDKKSFLAAVNAAIVDGWVPSGGLVRGSQYYQAMTRHASIPGLPPTTRMLTVTKGNLPTSRANLRCVARYNGAGYPRWKIFGGLPTSRRLRFFRDTQIEVYPGRVRADGSNTAYKVVPGQLDSFGKRVPDTIELYVLKADVT